MIIDRGAGRPVYELRNSIEWTAVNIPLAPEIEKALTDILREHKEVQEFLHACYQPLRQTGAADVSHIEVPKCVLDRAGRKASPTVSETPESSSSTKRTRTPSKSKATSGD